VEALAEATTNAVRSAAGEKALETIRQRGYLDRHTYIEALQLYNMMLTQRRKAGTDNVRFPKRVAVVDFSEYQEGGDILGYGAGIAIYEWPALAAFNIKLVAKACQMASSLATETADQLDKAIKLALYDLHWRDHKDLAAKYLQRIGNPLVREVLVDRPSTRLPRRSH